MYFVEVVHLNRTVTESPKLRCYGTILGIFDREKKGQVREVRMVKIEKGIRKVLKQCVRATRR